MVCLTQFMSVQLKETVNHKTSSRLSRIFIYMCFEHRLRGPGSSVTLTLTVCRVSSVLRFCTHESAGCFTKTEQNGVSIPCELEVAIKWLRRVLAESFDALHLFPLSASTQEYSVL